MTIEDSKWVDNKSYETWRIINDNLIEFANKATPKHFEFLFESDGARLFNHFHNDCNGIMQKFYTYLVPEQYAILLINCNENKTILYSL